jgi:hypothetical protein
MKWDNAPIEITGDDITSFPAEEIRNTWVEFPDCGAMGPEAAKDKGRRYLVTYEFSGREQTVLVYAPNAARAQAIVQDRESAWEGPTKVLRVAHAPGAKHEDVPPAWSGLRGATPAAPSARPCRDCNNRGYRYIAGTELRCDCEAGEKRAAEAAKKGRA